MGNVLFPDLPCRENHSQCQIAKELPVTKIRCVDQTILSNSGEYPSTKTYNNISYVSCMNDCVEN